MSRAFTLIELVVALGLGTALLATLLTLVVHGYRARAVLQGTLDSRLAEQAPFELLSQDCANLPAGAAPLLHENTLCLTTLNSLRSERLAARHAVDVTYTASPRDGERKLRRIERELNADDSAKGPDEQAELSLTGELETIRFQVFDGRSWFAEWPSGAPRDALALRVTLQAMKARLQERTLWLRPRPWRRHYD